MSLQVSLSTNERFDNALSTSSSVQPTELPDIHPSIGVFSDVFAGTGLYGDMDMRVQNKLRRSLSAAVCLIVILGGLLVSFVFFWQTDGGTDATPTMFDNRSMLGTLDLSSSNKHGICVPADDSVYQLWINGDLVAIGTACQLQILGHQDAPQCTNSGKSKMGKDDFMWIALEVQDSEHLHPNHVPGQSLTTEQGIGGVRASFQWCGIEIVTNENWRCDTHAPEHWQVGGVENFTNHLDSGCPGNGVATPDCKDPKGCCTCEDIKGKTPCPAWGKLADVYDIYDTSGNPISHAPYHPETLSDTPELGSSPSSGVNIPAQWIWSGPKEPNVNLLNEDSMYCRRKVSCHDAEYSKQFDSTTGQGAEATCELAEEEAEHVVAEEKACDRQASENAGNEGGVRQCNWGGHEGLFDSFTNFATGIAGFLLMMYMFVGFHIICDDFFVPSLNVLCEKLNMPDDIAGATFMAAGASSPELFASLIGVLTHSAVGVGTVVGSELFNMLIIVGGVCLVTPIPLTLDWRPLVREVFFFTISLVGVLVALYDSEMHVYESGLLMSGYLAYVAVCANYKKIMAHFCPAGNGSRSDVDEEFYIDYNLETPMADSLGLELQERMTQGMGDMEDGPDDPRRSFKVQLHGAAFGMDYGECLMHGFIFKKSGFYTKVKVSKSVWQKRWLVLTEDALFYTRKSGKDRVLVSAPISWSQAWVRSTSYTEFQLSIPGNDIVFKATQPLVARQWVKKLAARIEAYKSMSPASSSRMAGGLPEEQHDEEEEHHDMLAMPDTTGAKVFWAISFPMLVLFKYSIVDVRKHKWTDYYPVTMATSVVWLAIMSEGMMQGAETSGCIMGISEAVMGLTITAAGTSLPNLFASIIVAKQGLGNMSVSNAFGSNTFNIFVALALPWFIGGLLQGEDHACPNFSYSYPIARGKIFQSVEILGGVLFIMLATLVATNMMLTKSIGYAFIALYFVIMCFLVAS